LGDSFHRRPEILSRFASAELNAWAKLRFCDLSSSAAELFPPWRYGVPGESFLTRIVIQQFGVNDFLNEEHR
jgi:hypothetical protein